MWVKQCHKPPGNVNHTTYKNGESGDGLLLFYQHYHIFIFRNSNAYSPWVDI